jgi:hypothetical protein
LSDQRLLPRISRLAESAGPNLRIELSRTRLPNLAPNYEKQKRSHGGEARVSAPTNSGTAKNKSERSPANTSSQGRAPLVQFVAVPAAPMPYARDRHQASKRSNQDVQRLCPPRSCAQNLAALAESVETDEAHGLDCFNPKTIGPLQSKNDRPTPIRVQRR